MYKTMAFFVILILSSMSSAYAKLHDPTRPSWIGSKINKIFISSQKKFVVIDHKEYCVGDIYRGAKIKAIKSNAVELQDNTGQFTLELFKRVKKTPVQIRGS